MPTFFYDEQIRRYILQFLRCFADFKIELPQDANGVRVQHRVPIRYGDMSRQVGQILRDNAQNTSQIAPSMAGYITGIELAADRRQDPMFVNKKRILEREYNPETGEYTSEQGNRYTVESYMPTPYNMQMNLDLWTTNTTDKLQIFEQIACVFNPTAQVQTHDNPIDWSTITEIELTGVQWSSRSVPVGTDDAMDIMTLQFKIPIWISPPAKLTRQKIVEQINVTLFNLSIDKEDIDQVYDPLRSCFPELDQLIVTPGNHRIEVSAIDNETSEIELLDKFGKSNPNNSWELLFSVYGRIDPDNTRLRLKTADNIEDDSGDVLGSLEVSETESNKAFFKVDVDTLPQTLPSGPITAIIDPRKQYPGNGLPAIAPGQRYLLIDTSNMTAGEEPIIPMNTGLNPWGSIVAYENDIIEYSGQQWFTSFRANDVQGTVYVRNMDDGQHYRYDNGGWSYTFLGVYNPGYWRIEV